MRGAWASALLTFLVGCAHAPAPLETLESSPATGVHLTCRTVSYAVHGDNVSHLRAEMARIGPIDDGRHQFAHTWGTFAWHFTHEEGARGCLTSPVSVELEIVQTVPAWLRPRVASTETVREWARWLLATRSHESGHRAILLSTAGKLVAGLRALRQRCDEADLAANTVGDELLREMRKAHFTYDRDTEHGKKTGAVLRDDLP